METGRINLIPGKFYRCSDYVYFVYPRLENFGKEVPVGTYKYIADSTRIVKSCIREWSKILRCQVRTVGPDEVFLLIQINETKEKKEGFHRLFCLFGEYAGWIQVYSHGIYLKEVVPE